MGKAATTPNQSEWRIGPYVVERELREGASWLAGGPGGRKVVLKGLDNDCLLRGQLHPMIKDRLSRVRELAHLGVANLLGVERENERAYLIWEFIEGQTLDDFLAGRPHSDMLRVIARQVVLHIEMLHNLGIVHGSLHGRNIIVTPAGDVRLTHISPLLYTEPQADLAAVGRLLGQMGFGHAIGGEDGAANLREVFGRLASESDANTAPAARDEGGGLRRIALIGAIAVAILGAIIAWGIWQWVRMQSTAQTRSGDIGGPCLSPVVMTTGARS